MHDAASVRGLQRVGNAGAEPQRLARSQSSSLQSYTEGFTFDVLHHDEIAGEFIAVDFIDGTNAGVIERRSRACFDQEAFSSLFVSRAKQELDRDLAAKRQVVGEINVSHPAGTQHAQQTVVRYASPWLQVQVEAF